MTDYTLKDDEVEPFMNVEPRRRLTALHWAAFGVMRDLTTCAVSENVAK
jgi:hypothetical protein